MKTHFFQFFRDFKESVRCCEQEQMVPERLTELLPAMQFFQFNPQIAGDISSFESLSGLNLDTACLLFSVNFRE